MSSRPSCGLRIDNTVMPARSVYRSLLEAPSSAESLRASHAFLEEQLRLAAAIPETLPLQPQALEHWMEQQTLLTGDSYSHYLASRRAGEPRLYFTSRSHALSFLQGVAPTKLVDGAWLYGVLQKWDDHRFFPLVQTYLEELGDGNPAHNHVVLYQRLLQQQGCDLLPDLSDDHYTQGAIQLALAYHANEFMPEVLGYNLGYEQLPLHLLVTAFELNELDIDPYYFTLHVTIDNASTGHARKAVQSVLNLLPRGGDAAAFLQRVSLGLRLNDLGLGTTSVIESFDLERELLSMLRRKSKFGKSVHSDYCRIGGRTVNDWLARPADIPEMLKILQSRGWINRHEDPERSRFWRLIDGPGGQMFGVFSPVEKQLLYDWIAGDWLNDTAGKASGSTGTGIAGQKALKRRRSAGASQRAVQNHQQQASARIKCCTQSLQQELEGLSYNQRMRRLIALMAPGRHSTDEGLLATQMFTSGLAANR